MVGRAIRDYQEPTEAKSLEAKSPETNQWSGREIRIAFQMAMDFAEDSRRKEEGPTLTTALLKRNHFARVLKLEQTFQENLTNASKGRDDYSRNEVEETEEEY